MSNAYDIFQVTPTATDPRATLTVDGERPGLRAHLDPMDIFPGKPKTLTIVVTAPAGNTKTYTVTVTRRYVSGLTAASGADVGDAFGYSVAISGNTMVVGAPYEDSAATTIDGNEQDNSASTSGAAYVFVRSPKGSWQQMAYLKPSNNRYGAQFGASVAIDKDMVVVGAPDESSAATGVGGNQADTSAAGAGAAYVFVRDSSGNWSQAAYLKASNTDAGDNFGHAVAVSQGTVAVSAILEASAAVGVGGDQASNVDPGAGAVYLFHQTPKGVWYQVAYVKASNTNPHDSFGTSVALDGSILAVGAQSENSNATGVNGDQSNNTAAHAGAVYVFSRNVSGVWAQQAYLKASNTGSPDLFGRSVTVSGTTVVVGAAGESSNATGVNGNQADNSASDAGAAYVFVRDGSGKWHQQAYLKASNTDAGDIFGQAVALDHDTLVVGALDEASGSPGVNGNQGDNSVSKAGAAYLFTRNAAGKWTQRAYVKAPFPTTSDFFGVSVGVSGDTLLVGADETPRTSSGIGAVYLY